MAIDKFHASRASIEPHVVRLKEVLGSMILGSNLNHFINCKFDFISLDRKVSQLSETAGLQL